MLCCPVQVEVSETGWSLVQRSPTVCLNRIMQKARGNHCIKKILTDIPSISSLWELLQTNLNDWKQWETLCTVSMDSDYRLKEQGSILGRGRRIFFSSLCVQTSSEAHAASCTVSTGGRYSIGKARPGLDADHSLPSSAVVKSEYEIYFLSPLAPAWQRDSFISHILCVRK
jgi:hypothetical protein